ncbi:MAG: LytTR family DNA-binding domain-containing protein [Vicinamibacterales bacterium]
MNATPSITALIVEDEPLARRRLRELIRDVAWLHCVGEATTGRAAIAAIDELQPDLVFLDVQLPGCSGIDVLTRVRHTPAVIFTTAHDQFAITAFELAALDYLLKPFGRERFARAIERARPLLERQVDSATVDRAREVMTEGTVPRLFVREAGRIVPLRVASIEWLQACDDFVVVHAGGRQFRVNLTLSDLERRLDPRIFVRVHRSHLVNLDHVASWTPYDGSRLQITLRTGRTLMASRQRSRVLRELGR